MEAPQVTQDSLTVVCDFHRFRLVCKSVFKISNHHLQFRVGWSPVCHRVRLNRQNDEQTKKHEYKTICNLNTHNNSGRGMHAGERGVTLLGVCSRFVPCGSERLHPGCEGFYGGHKAVECRRGKKARAERGEGGERQGGETPRGREQAGGR